MPSSVMLLFVLGPVVVMVQVVGLRRVLDRRLWLVRLPLRRPDAAEEGAREVRQLPDGAGGRAGRLPERAGGELPAVLEEAHGVPHALLQLLLQHRGVAANLSEEIRGLRLPGRGGKRRFINAQKRNAQKRESRDHSGCRGSRSRNGGRGLEPHFRMSGTVDCFRFPSFSSIHRWMATFRAWFWSSSVVRRRCPVTGDVFFTRNHSSIADFSYV